MQRISPGEFRTYPLSVWFLVLGLIFGAEYLVMVMLPWLLPTGHSRLFEAMVDAVVLTSILAPALWKMLVNPLREAMTLQAQFLAHSLSSIEAERRHLAYELHDGVGQSMTLLISGLRSVQRELEEKDLLRRLHNLEDIAKTSLQDVKKLSRGLRPSLLDDLGLAPAIERIAAEIQENHDLVIQVDVAEVAGSRLSENVEITVFRIIQESLNNIVKHSGARNALVKIERADGLILVHVEDDGRGMQSDLLDGGPTVSAGLGLVGMQERVTLLGGKLSIEARLGQGTHVLARIPEGVGR